MFRRRSCVRSTNRVAFSPAWGPALGPERPVSPAVCQAHVCAADGRPRVRRGRMLPYSRLARLHRPGPERPGRFASGAEAGERRPSSQADESNRLPCRCRAFGSGSPTPVTENPGPATHAPTPNSATVAGRWALHGLCPPTPGRGRSVGFRLSPFPRIVEKMTEESGLGQGHRARGARGEPVGMPIAWDEALVAARTGPRSGAGESATAACTTVQGW